jgi:hypothetical protein
MVRSSEEGWLQGFITVTTFMTWHRNFEWDSLSKHNGISSCDRETRAVDADGALASLAQSPLPPLPPLTYYSMRHLCAPLR